MITSGKRLLEEYGQLNRNEQYEFDREYKKLMKFRRNLNFVAQTIEKLPTEKAGRVIDRLLKKMGEPTRSFATPAPMKGKVK